MLKQIASAMVLALGLLPGVGAAPLTTEAELAQASTANEIEDFWEKHGVISTFPGARGVSITYATFRQPAGASEQGALVIVSGRTESMLKYKETVRDLWNNGWSVYIHDHRGQGLSAREAEVADRPERGYVNDFEDYVRDLRTMVADHVLPNGHKRHVVMGHSMGGAITALFLERDWPEVARFDGAVLSSPMLKIKAILGKPAKFTCLAMKVPSAVSPTAYVPGGGDYAAKTFLENEYSQSPIRYQRLVDQVADKPAIKLGSPTVRWLDRACTAAHEARTQAKKVRTPIRVFVAGADQIVHEEGATEFCANLSPKLGGCGGSGGKPVVVAGAQHELFIELDGLRKQALEPALSFFAGQR